MAATVIVQQPLVNQVSQTSSWTSGLCDCCLDMSSCCYAFWCCPCFACSTTGEFGESTCLPLLDIFGPGFMSALGFPVCVPPVTLGMRVAVRHKYKIRGSLCDDIMVTCCCIWCSWCQMNREIKERKKTFTLVTAQPMIHTVPTIPTVTTTTHVMQQQSTGMIQTGQPFIMNAASSYYSS